MCAIKRDCGLTFAKADPYPPLTGANLLLTRTGTLGCWVSPLAHCVPPQEQPDPLGLLPGVHVDAGLSADTGST
jgi:hypothetical protein